MKSCPLNTKSKNPADCQRLQVLTVNKEKKHDLKYNMIGIRHDIPDLTFQIIPGDLPSNSELFTMSESGIIEILMKTEVET